MQSDRKTQLINKMIHIFNHHKLNQGEIKRLLRPSASFKRTQRIDDATKQLADLLLEEDLSIQEGSDIIHGCYETLFGKKPHER